MIEAVVLSWLDLLNLTLDNLCAWTALLDDADEPIKVFLAGAALEYEGLVQVPVVQVDLVRSHVERRSRLLHEGAQIAELQCQPIM